VPTCEPSGGLESGLVASLTGSVRIAIVSGGVAGLAGAVVVVRALRALWRYDARAIPASGPPQPGRSPRCPTCHDTKEVFRGWVVFAVMTSRRSTSTALVARSARVRNA
jgi:hypothetical protein